MRIALILFIAGFATLATAGPVVFRVSDPVNPGETALLFGDGIGPDATAEGWRARDGTVSDPPTRPA